MSQLARLLAIAALLAPAIVGAQAGPVVRMEFSNPELTPSHWTITISPDGTGHFRSQGAAPGSQVVDVVDLDRDIRLSPRFVQRIFATAASHNWFAVECESHYKVAFQGWKTLSYASPDGSGSCRFNFSKDKEIQAACDSLVAVVETILEGARLQKLLAYDRLGLDKEMAYLVEAAGDGRMQQMSTIRGILERLAEDPVVMDRVRKRARLLLAHAGE